MDLPTLASLIVLVLSGAVAGLYFAFSVSVMPALDAGEARVAVAAMRRINRAILNPLFLIPFFATPLVAWGAAGLMLAGGAETAAAWLGLAGLTYALGSLLPTMVVNVPLNQRLDRAPEPADEAEARAIWQAYSPRWTWWNSLRAIATFASLVLAGAGLAAWGAAAS